MTTTLAVVEGDFSPTAIFILLVILWVISLAVHLVPASLAWGGAKLTLDHDPNYRQADLQFRGWTLLAMLLAVPLAGPYLALQSAQWWNGSSAPDGVLIWPYFHWSVWLLGSFGLAVVLAALIRRTQYRRVGGSSDVFVLRRLGVVLVFISFAVPLTLIANAPDREFGSHLETAFDYAGHQVELGESARVITKWGACDRDERRVAFQRKYIFQRLGEYERLASARQAAARFEDDGWTVTREVSEPHRVRGDRLVIVAQQGEITLTMAFWEEHLAVSASSQQCPDRQVRDNFSLRFTEVDSFPSNN